MAASFTFVQILSGNIYGFGGLYLNANMIQFTERNGIRATPPAGDEFQKTQNQQSTAFIALRRCFAIIRSFALNLSGPVIKFT